MPPKSIEWDGQPIWRTSPMKYHSTVDLQGNWKLELQWRLYASCD